MSLLGNPVITVAPSLATNCQLMLSIRPKVSSKKLVATEKHSIETFSLNITSSDRKNRQSLKSLKWPLVRQTLIKITRTHWFKSRFSSRTMYSSLLDPLKKRLRDAREALSVMSTGIGSRARLVIFREKTVHLVVAKEDQTNNSQKSLVKVSNHPTNSFKQHLWPQIWTMAEVKESWDQIFPTVQASIALSHLLKYNSMPQATLLIKSRSRVLSISSQGNLTTMSWWTNSSQWPLWLLPLLQDKGKAIGLRYLALKLSHLDSSMLKSTTNTKAHQTICATFRTIVILVTRIWTTFSGLATRTISQNCSYLHKDSQQERQMQTDLRLGTPTLNLKAAPVAV